MNLAPAVRHGHWLTSACLSFREGDNFQVVVIVDVQFEIIDIGAVASKRMQTMGGWIRLGIVLTVLWLLGYPLYWHLWAWARDWERYDACTRLLPVDQCHRPDTFIITDSLLYTVTIATAIFFWVLISVVVVTIRWVLRGFTKIEKGQ